MSSRSQNSASRQEYQTWVEEQIEEYKTTLTREELMDFAEKAVQQLFESPDEQIPLTEILLCDVVDALLFEKLNLPSYREWRRSCRSDTKRRPLKRTAARMRAAS